MSLSATIRVKTNY